MRWRGLIAAAGLLWWACMDSAGPGGSHPGQLHIVPNFNSRSAIVDVRSIDVSLTRLDGSEAARVVVEVAPGEKEFDIRLEVRVFGGQEDFDLSIVLRDESDQIVYRNDPNPQRITISLGTSSPVDLSMEYHGTGSEAETLEIMPVDPTVGAGQTIELTAIARDSSGNPVTGMPVEWEALDPLVTIAQAGPTTPSVGVIDAGSVGGVAIVQVRDANGNVSTANVTVQVNAPPSPVTIEQPTPGAIFTIGDGVTFQGTASDPEDGDLSGDALEWTSDQDGVLGNGSSVTRSDLSLGAHIVTLTATDTEGMASAASVDITVVEIPVVTFGEAARIVGEGAGTVNITATLSVVSSVPVSVPFTVSGTATQDDYTISSSPLTIAPGQTTGDIAVTLTDDSITEVDETIVVTMGEVANATVGAIPETTLSVVDDDGTPSVSFTVPTQSAAENSGSVTVTAQLSSASSLPVTIPFTAGGSAVAPDDYTITGSPLTIPVGQTDAVITINLVDDALVEPEETVIVTMGAPTNATQGAVPLHTVTIIDDESPPAVDFVSGAEAVSEGIGVHSVELTLSAPSSLPITIPFTVSGTATNPDDYTITASPLTVAAGLTSATILFSVVDDATTEIDETVIVTIGAPTNAVAGEIAEFTLTIADDDVPSVSFGAGARNVSEGAATVIITADLSMTSPLIVSVPFVVSGTASDPDDYTITASPMSFAAGETTASLTITLVDDALAEPGETIVVTLVTPTNAVLGAIAEHTVTISDNEGAPSVSFATDVGVETEGVGSVLVTADLSAVASQDVTVPFTVSGTATDLDDYTISASPLTVPAGSTTGAITITVVDDAVTELDETVVIAMGTPVNAVPGAITSHTHTITDNDFPNVSFVAASQIIGEGTGAVALSVALSAPTSRTVVVPYTATGTAANLVDYTMTASPLTIAAGQTTADITVTALDDVLDEVDETVIVTIGTPTNAIVVAPAEHTITITDDDPAPIVDWTFASQNVAEDAGAVTVTGQLSTMSSLPVTIPFTVSGTALTPDDYTISPSPLTIPAGQTTADVTITVVDDGDPEVDELVILTMGTPTNGTVGSVSVHTTTILANDATVSLDLATLNAPEEGGPVTLNAVLDVVLGVSVTWPFTVSGTATSGVDYTVSASPLVIPAGQTTAPITITPVNDLTGESDETVLVTMGVPTNATVGNIAQSTVTIVNDDPGPVVNLTTASQTVAEDVGTITVTAQADGVSEVPVHLLFTVGGTAAAPADFTIISPLADTLTIPAGQLTADISIAVVDDVAPELDETITIQVDLIVNGVAGTTLQHIATVTDNDVPTVSFAVATLTAVEDTGTVGAVVTLSEISALPVTVPFTVTGSATAGTDYTIASSPLTIPAGQASGQITITSIDDALDENDESVSVTLGTPTNATLGAITDFAVTLTDNDPLPTWNGFTVSAASVDEGGATLDATVSIDVPSGLVVTVPFTVSGTAVDIDDYTITPSPVTIPAGQTTGTITITLVEDFDDEPDETVILQTGTPVNAQPGSPLELHTATILDNDAPPLSNTVVFTSNRTGQEEVWIVDGAGGLEVQLTTSGGEMPEISPDGSRIAFMRANDIFVMGPDGTGEVNLTNGVGQNWTPTWSPDGQTIAFSRNFQLHTMDADGSNIVPLPNGAGNNYGADYSPDGSTLAFHSDRDGNLEIYTMDVGTGAETRLTNDVLDDLGPDWSPDGSKIAFISNRFETPTVFSVNPDGTSVHEMTVGTSGVGWVSWAPSRELIVYRQGGDLFTSLPDGSAVSQISTGGSNANAPPKWGPCLDSVCEPLSGAIEFEITTIGTTLDPDGYTITIDGGQGQAVSTNDFLTVYQQSLGVHTVDLTGVATNCLVSSPNPQTLTVNIGQLTFAQWNVECFDPFSEVSNAILDFECAFGNYVLGAGLLGDELADGQLSAAFWDFDRRTMAFDGLAGSLGCAAPPSGGIVLPLAGAYASAEAALTILDPGIPAEVDLAAIAAAYSGYSLLLMGEGQCSVDLGSGPQSTPVDAWNVAVARFTEAISDATVVGNTIIQQLATLGRARASLNLGDVAFAAADAAAIPDAFLFNAGFDGVTFDSFNHVFDRVNNLNELTIESDFQGLTVLGVPDPRVPVQDAGRNAVDGITPLFTQSKYTGLDSHIAIARGAEARLIEAEAALQAGDIAGFLTFINSLRSTAGLPAATDPGTPAARTALMIDERARELFLEGHHLGDKRRYGSALTPFTPPAGALFKDGATTYGTVDCFALPPGL